MINMNDIQLTKLSFSEKIGLLRDISYAVNPNEIPIPKEELVKQLTTAQHHISSAAPLGDSHSIEGWVTAFLSNYRSMFTKVNGSMLYYYRHYARVLLEHCMNNIYDSPMLGIAV